MTSQRHDCRSDPVGAWMATSMHSSMSAAGTSRSKSSRLRTVLVVVRSSSGSSANVGTDVISLPPLRGEGGDGLHRVRIRAEVAGEVLFQLVGVLEREGVGAHH